MKTALAILLVIILAAGAWFVWLRRGKNANIAVSNAWAVSSGQVELSPEFYSDYGVPDSLKTRDEVALYYFEMAVRLAPERSSAYYNLGLWYLNQRDCHKARAAFEKHAAFLPRGDPKMKEILAAFGAGCDAARTFIWESRGESTGIDAEE